MSKTWLFKDEWLLKALAGVPGAGPEEIARLRSETKTHLSHALLDSGALSPDRLAALVERCFRIKFCPVTAEKADKFAISLLGERNCRRYDLVPLGADESDIRVAMAEPLNFNYLSDIEALTGRRVVPFYSVPRDIDLALAQLFSGDSVIFDLLRKVEVPEEIEVVGERLAETRDDVSSPVILLVNSIISQAYRKKSSDIHIEHEEKASHVRIRIDGELRSVMTLPKYLAAGPVVSRIKIMADMDVSNHMKPQDGRTKIRIGSAEVGLRVSTLPTSYGEKVVMRILDQRAAEVPFEKLGFAPEVAAAMQECLDAPQGILLITGPTGSGKTTTLYSALNKCKDESTNVVTVEDPIEYKLPGINQVQVNDKQGLGFAAVLRSVLRQDPDIIMVGEIRDRETADIAFQAAMTGHLVLSTLHTNDTVSTISRLVDMGIDRFKISPGLLAITAQRLLRRLCPDCSVEVPEAQLPAPVAEMMAFHGLPKRCRRPVGCKKCEGSGYSGRTSVVELLRIDTRLREMINLGVKEAEIKRRAMEAGTLRTMTKDALWQLSEGRTSVDEIKPYLISDEHESAAAGASAPAAREAVPAEARHPSAAAPAASSAPPAAAAPPSGAVPRVMVADDDPIMRMLLRNFITGAGYQYCEAADGEEALTAIASGPPDLLISDINMPRLNGLDLVKGIRQNLGLADLPVIMLTTESSDKSQELAFSLGADDYIIKPFKGPLVLARVGAALRRAGKIK
ncbi:MAG: ATPase, T2SS/T4P/T4SS family [Elusimicrobiales bacterium]|nr:ATPase, T2SS/T4P/T4SS family [Elusimicrobiales bacterium]